MENKILREKPSNVENKLAKIKKTALGLLLFATFALTVSACGPQELPYYSEPTTNIPPLTQSVEEVTFLNSIDERELTLNPIEVSVSKSTPLEMEISNGVIISIAKPPLPCGEPSTFTPVEEPPTVLYRNEREQLCYTIIDIANNLGIKLEQEQIETIASQMIIVSNEDNTSICGIDKAGCYLPIPKMIVMYDTSDTVIIHEKTHATILSDDKYMDISDKACFLYDYARGGFTMVYENNSSSTGYSIAHISQEFVPSVFEQLLIKKKQEQGNFYTNYPRYFIGSQMSEDKKEALRQMFDSLNFSQTNYSFILKNSPITMTTLFEFLETVSGPPKYIARFTELFSQNMASQNLEKHTPISESEVSPNQACQPLSTP